MTELIAQQTEVEAADDAGQREEHDDHQDGLQQGPEPPALYALQFGGGQLTLLGHALARRRHADVIRAAPAVCGGEQHHHCEHGQERDQQASTRVQARR
ncbi:MAG: hypothetical protein J2P17_33110, partial [Mycobacterium sp.]|nr:hypothetical protein [Mycobacterium sp.]